MSSQDQKVEFTIQPSIHSTAVVRNSQLGAYSSVGPECKLNDSTLGDYSYVVHHVSVSYASIGKFCSIAPFVRIHPENHPTWRAAQHQFTYRSRQYSLAEDDESFFEWRRQNPVKIGHDVWIGHCAVIMPGVTIGIGGAVGANAVVTKDVPPFTIVAGVPAKPIRQRIPDSQIDRLTKLAWWDWSHECLRQALPDFRQLSILEFIQKYENCPE